jgi:AcrR family transcriptional regulator
MTPDERRQAIIEATWPLLLERGPELSTREIAQAAGVAEGTIFRAFETKSDIIHAAIHAAIEPNLALATLAGLPAGQGLDQRVANILTVLADELTRTRSLFSHLSGAGFGHGRGHPPTGGGPPPGPPEGPLRMLDATAVALQPYAGQLSVSVATAARLLNALAFAASFGATTGDGPPNPESLADVVLHGIAEGEK